MLDTPVVHISVVVGITYLVYRLKMGDYGICSYVDKPISHLIMLSCVLVFSESYLVLSIILLVFTSNVFVVILATEFVYFGANLLL